MIVEIIYLIFAGLSGTIIGFACMKAFIFLDLRRSQKNLMKVINGTKENNLNLEGKLIKVNSFVITKDNKEVHLDISGETQNEIKN